MIYYGQDWNEHQQQQGKWDVVWEHILGHRIRVWRATTTTTAKTEITINSYRESGTWSERTYWDIGSECEGWWQWPRLKWTSAMTREVEHGLRAHTGTQDQSAKGDDDGQDWNHHQQLQGKWDMVWENLLGHQIRVRRVMTTAKAKMNISDNKGSGMWSESMYWDTGSEREGQQQWPRLKSPSATTGKAGHGLRELTGTPDPSMKGDDNDHNWNEHQQQQGKGDIVRENLLGNQIWARRVMTMTMTEMSISDDKGSGTWLERTYWDTGSEHEGQWQWLQLKWASATTREVGCSLRELTGTPDMSTKGDDNDHNWNEHQ